MDDKMPHQLGRLCLILAVLNSPPGLWDSETGTTSAKRLRTSLCVKMNRLTTTLAANCWVKH